MRFSDPNLNNSLRRIKEGIQNIRKGISKLVDIKDEEFSTFEHSPQIHRLIKYFSTMDTKQVEEFLNNVEQLPAEEAKKKINL